MEGKSLQKKNVSLNFKRKTNIGLERGGQADLSIKTHLVLMQINNMKWNIMIYIGGFLAYLIGVRSVILTSFGIWLFCTKETFQMKFFYYRSDQNKTSIDD